MRSDLPTKFQEKTFDIECFEKLMTEPYFFHYEINVQGNLTARPRMQCIL